MGFWQAEPLYGNANGKLATEETYSIKLGTVELVKHQLTDWSSIFF